MRTVGLLGGMGPEATVLFMQRLIATTPARDDAGHVPLIVHQNPAVPSRIRFLLEGGGDDPGPVLAGMARALQAAGAQALAMPCNTAHAFAPAIRAASDLPFLDMRAATVARLPTALAGGRLGLLASPAVRRTGAFDAALAAAVITPVWPDDEEPVLSLIRAVKAGATGRGERAELGRLATSLRRDCDHLLVACTELSPLTDAIAAAGLAFTDSLDCLVEEVAAFAHGAGG